MQQDTRVPVALITGFLGSGKTTLLNRLLKHPGMAATAVIINEFGDIALDQLFVEKTDGEVMVLANGCLCCSVQDDIQGVIGSLFASREAGSVPAFERMVIETSGLADPAPIMQMLLNQPLVTPHFRLDSVVTLVDAVHGQRHVREHEEAFKQVALADRLVITKADLVGRSEVDAVEAWLRELNPAAELMSALEGDLSPEALFGSSELATKEHAVRWAHAGHSHDHSSGVVACSLTHDAALRWRDLNRWLTAFRIKHGERLLRLKGVVEIEGQDAPVAVHGVHHVFHPPLPLEHLAGQGLRGARLVVIGRDIAETEIRGSWQRFIDEVSAEAQEKGSR